MGGRGNGKRKSVKKAEADRREPKRLREEGARIRMDSQSNQREGGKGTEGTKLQEETRSKGERLRLIFYSEEGPKRELDSLASKSPGMGEIRHLLPQKGGENYLKKGEDRTD